MDTSKISKTFQKLADKQAKLEYSMSQIAKAKADVDQLVSEIEVLEGFVLLNPSVSERLAKYGVRTLDNRLMTIDVTDDESKIVFSPVIIGYWELKDE